MKVKGLDKQKFADKTRRNPSEITKWLSGTHTFSIDTLQDIDKVLDIARIDF